MNMQGYFTKQGLELAAKLAAGTALTITRVVAGSGTTATDASGLALPCQTLAVNTPTHSGSMATLPVTLAAAQAGSNYSLTELGVYAQDPEKGEILYKVYRLDTPVDIIAGSRMVLRFYLEETVSGEVSVSVACSPAGLLTEADLAAAFQSRMTEEMVIRHVAKTGSDEIGNGSAENPFLTIQRAVNSLPKYLRTEADIIVHTGAYNEDVLLSEFAGMGPLKVAGAEGESVQIRAVNVWNDNVSIILENFDVTGELKDHSGCSLLLNNAPYVYLNNIVCTQPQSESPWFGAVRMSYTNAVIAMDLTVSNKQIAFDILTGTLYLNSTDTGENNTVAIRCGSGWGKCGGFVQKGGAAIEGTEQTAFSGQIF